jgi:hypothetical protein
MLVRLSLVVLSMSGVSLACSGLQLFSAEPQTAGDNPSLNSATAEQVEGVPYCSGGARAQHCVLGKNCRVTEAGCQVCQCASPAP